MREGRTLTVEQGAEELVEVRSASGALELRIRLTEAGPVLEMESVRLVLSAAGAVDVECADFSVNAARSVEIEAGGDVRVSGDVIHLN